MSMTENRDIQGFAAISIMGLANSIISSATIPAWSCQNHSFSANRNISGTDGWNAQRFETLIYDLQNLGILKRA